MFEVLPGRRPGADPSSGGAGLGGGRGGTMRSARCTAPIKVASPTRAQTGGGWGARIGGYPRLDA